MNNPILPEAVRPERQYSLRADLKLNAWAIQLEACLFATTAKVFLVTTLSLLEGVGVLQTLRLQHGLGWEGTFAAIIGFYILGNMIANRGYR